MEFDSTTHTYTLSGKYLTSATQLITRYFGKRDTGLIISDMLANGLNDKYKALVGSSPLPPEEAIREHWQNAISRGIEFHSAIESYLNGAPVAHPWLERFSRFWDRLSESLASWGLEEVHSEYRLHDERALVAGTADCILVNRNRECIILDWKCSSNIASPPERDHPRMRHGDHPFEKYEDSNYSRYLLQLNLYAKMCPWKPVELALVFFPPDSDDYHVVRMPIVDLTEEWEVITEHNTK